MPKPSMTFAISAVITVTGLTSPLSQMEEVKECWPPAQLYMRLYLNYTIFTKYFYA